VCFIIIKTGEAFINRTLLHYAQRSDPVDVAESYIRSDIVTAAGARGAKGARTTSLP